MRSFTIITIKPNTLIAPIDNRMSAILSEEFEDLWLEKDPKDMAKILALLKPYNRKNLIADTVAKKN